MRDYAVQTHIDPESFSHSVTASQPVAGAPTHKNSPADEKPDNCPLCQQLYGGQYVAPVALPLFVSFLTVSVIETVLGMMPRFDAVSHSWRSRGPPRT